MVRSGLCAKATRRCWPPRASALTAAALLVAAGDNRERMKSERSFAALCALSPVQA